MHLSKLFVSGIERSDIYQEALKAALDGLQSRIWTAMPAIIQSVSLGPDGRQTATVQPAIQAKVTQPDGKMVDVSLPPIADVLLIFPGGGGFTLTFPVGPGDEALVIFARNCIDGWFESGQVSPQAELRMHSLSDGFALVGTRSIPRLLGNISTSSVQLRSDDGSTYVELAGGQMVNVVAPGGINLNGVRIDGSGNTDFGSGTVKQGGKHIDSTHFHGGVASGGSNTNPVTGP